MNVFRNGRKAVRRKELVAPEVRRLSRLLHWAERADDRMTQAVKFIMDDPKGRKIVGYSLAGFTGLMAGAAILVVSKPELGTRLFMLFGSCLGAGSTAILAGGACKVVTYLARESAEEKLEQAKAKPRSLIDAKDLQRLRRQQRRRP